MVISTILCLTMVLLASAGTKGRYVEPVSRNKGEHEVILPRGMSLKLRSDKPASSHQIFSNAFQDDRQRPTIHIWDADIHHVPDEHKD